MGGVTLVNDWTNALGTNDSPDEEGQTSSGHDVSLNGEQMPDLLDGEPDRWQAAGPKEQKANEHDSVGAGGRDAIGDIIRSPVIPDGADHEINALAPNPRLHAVPDASHGSAVEDRP